jgi:Do/DeqQ family serine protease
MERQKIKASKFSLLLLLLIVCSFPSFSKTDQEEFIEVAKAVMPSIVNIRTKTVVKQSVVNPFDEFFYGESSPRETEKEGASLGSGFVIDKDGLIMTNNHVIADAAEIYVKFDNGKEYLAEIMGKDPETDLAMLKIINTKEKFKPMHMANSDNVEVGQWAIAIGNPFGFNNTMTLGIISATGRSGYGLERYEDYIQTDASINPGNSGGPLIDIYGNVIGVNTWAWTSTGESNGVGFAIPINIVKKVAESIKKYGEVRRPMLGVRFQPDFDAKLAESMGLDSPNGALIAEVFDESPAEIIGLKKGDVILSINDRPIENYSQAVGIIGTYQPGEEITLKVFRKEGKNTGKERTVSVVLTSRDEDNLNPSSDLLGMKLRTLNEVLRNKYDLPDVKKGIAVLEVDRKSQAARLGITEGSLILEINNIEVQSVKELREVYDKISNGSNILLYIEKNDYGRYLLLKKD